MPLQIVRNDITKMTTDAIVNAANSSLKMGGGVCGAIFRAAGPKQLQEACDRVGHCAVGEAVHTKGFELESVHHPYGWTGMGRRRAKRGNVAAQLLPQLAGTCHRAWL